MSAPSVRRVPAPVLAFAVLSIAGLAALAGAGLWILQRMYRQAEHAEAARAVLEVGNRLAGQFARHPAASAPRASDAAWSEFSRMAYSLGLVEPGLRYVSVAEDGVVLYHEELAAGRAATEPGGAARIGRTVLKAADGDVPVLTFTLPVVGGDARRSVQVAIRRDAVEQREAAALAALAAMFRTALGAIAVSFALTAVVIGWLVGRELRRERRRRQDEHLAFAGAMADGIIHDFRNPLSALKLDVQMIQREAARGAEARPERLGELGGRAARTIDRIDALLKEFLFVGRPDAAAREPVDLVACVRDCLDLLTPRFERLGVAIAAKLPEGGAVVEAHPAGLKRALLNILTNAEQASAPGGTIRVEVRVEPDAGVIEVADEGPGIPRHLRGRVFDMFVSGRPGGTGLGLSLARTAIEGCGGRVTAEEPRGRGARLVVRLPLAPEGEDGGANSRSCAVSDTKNAR